MAVILTLSGIFVSFESREVIAGGLTLDSVTLIIMVGAGAYSAGVRLRGNGAAPSWIASILGGVVVGLMLAVLAVIEANVDLRLCLPT
ncbi:MAG: hypothetical protein U0703_24165 [Anaerolineae bacterium]